MDKRQQPESEPFWEDWILVPFAVQYLAFRVRPDDACVISYWGLSYQCPSLKLGILKKPFEVRNGVVYLFVDLPLLYLKKRSTQIETLEEEKTGLEVRQNKGLKNIRRIEGKVSLSCQDGLEWSEFQMKTEEEKKSQ